MDFNVAITTPWPALMLAAAALIGVGWWIAVKWQPHSVRRLRARNHRIIAKVRRLSRWRPPVVRREPGNWSAYPPPGSPEWDGWGHAPVASVDPGPQRPLSVASKVGLAVLRGVLSASLVSTVLTARMTRLAARFGYRGERSGTSTVR